MSQCVSRTLLAAAILARAVGAGAQPHASTGETGHVLGAVRDERGVGVSGARILAIGATVTQVVADAAGMFAVALPPGLYVLWADRDGYTPSSTTAVRVGANHRIERALMLRRQSAFVDADENPSAVAWRLRHLSRTVLRDVRHAPASAGEGGGPFVDRRSLGVPVSGHVNLFTSRPVELGRADRVSPSAGAASFVLKPPGDAGAWGIRGAMSSGSTSGWGVLGHYGTQRGPHRLGLVAAVAGQSMTTEPLTADVAVHVATVRVHTNWQVSPRLEFQPSIRLDRDDALASAALFSPELTLHARVGRAMRVSATASRVMAGPQTGRLLADAANPVWVLPGYALPDDQRAHGGLRPEIVSTARLAVEHDIVGSGAVRVGGEWFTQHVTNQLALTYTRRTDAREYAAVGVGNFAAQGWTLKLNARLVDALRASFELTTGAADWGGAVPFPRSRHGRDQVLVTRTTVSWAGEQGTRVAVGHRRGRMRPVDPHGSARPLVNDSVTVSLQTRAPVQPLAGVMLTLFFDCRPGFEEYDATSLYDGVLTTGFPALLSGGLQVKF
jgi:hypothetical protein